MNRFVAGYLAAALVMVVLDMLWLGVVASSMCQQAIGHLMAKEPKVLAAIVFYALCALILVVFALAPQAADAGWGKALCMGALFGFFAYTTDDLSNLATLRNWPVHLALIDMAWGTALSAAAGCAGKVAMNWATKTWPLRLTAVSRPVAVIRLTSAAGRTVASVPALGLSAATADAM